MEGITIYLITKMFKIPNTDKKYSQTNISDTSGNIWYTKNINFDEFGYLKLSSRSVSIASIDEYANFAYPLSIGRKNLTGGSYIETSDHSFILALSNAALSITDDGTGGTIPVGSINNRGKWWQNAWHVTTQTTLKSRDGVTDTWSSHGGVSLTTAYPHPLEVFRSRTTLCIGNANVVNQFTTAYASSTADLTLPSDYTVIDLAFNNEQMGIATQLANTLAGQNQEAVFALWDGLATSANSIYPVGSDAIISVKAYKSSWVLLTRNGRLLYFNGGGFDTLATLPFFFKKYNVGADTMVGDIMTVQGDLIYLNIPADINYFGVKQERFLQNFNGGILCYDPKVGLYHRYSPSISKLTAIQVSSVNTSTGVLTASSGTIPDTGNPILYTSDVATPIGGLTVGVLYYVIKIDATTFKLATTKANATAGTFITLTSSTTATFMGLTLVDYGSSRGTNTNAVITMGNQDFFYDHLMFGGYYENTSLTPKQNLCLTIPQFPNRGYYVSSKLESQQMEDNDQSIFIKHQPLKSTDSIIIKHKDKDIVGIPSTTPQRGKSATWTSTTTLTTTADISEVYTYLQGITSTDLRECEIEIISGTGAGQMLQISSVSYSTGTYTITVAEEADGVANGNLCYFIIDNWKKFGIITTDGGNNWKQFPIASTNKWHKFKIELRGVDTTIEELQIINKVQEPSS